MFHEKKDKTPEENLAIAKIQVMFEDAFGISNSDSTPATIDRAKHWFETRDCALWCEMAGTTQDHVKKLFDIVQSMNEPKKAGKKFYELVEGHTPFLNLYYSIFLIFSKNTFSE